MDSVKVTISVEGREDHSFEGRFFSGSLLVENEREGRRNSKLLLVGKANPEEIIQSMAAATAQTIASVSEGDPKLIAILLQLFKSEIRRMMKPGGYDITGCEEYLTKEEVEENNG